MKQLKKDLQAVTREHKKLAQKILLWQYFIDEKHIKFIERTLTMNRNIILGFFILCIFLGMFLMSAIAMATNEKLSPVSVNYKAGLRERVEKLKSDLIAESTNNNNIPERLDILWDWANAYAMTGGQIPVELPFMVSVIRSLPVEFLYSYMYKMIDGFIQELKVRDENPGAIGKLHLETSGPFPVNSLQTINQIYTVGDMSVKSGGGFLVTQHVWSYYDNRILQFDNPLKENYVTIESSNPKAKFKVTTVMYRGMMHAGFNIGRQFPIKAFILEEGVLVKGDTVTVTYGDRSKGSPGLRIQSMTNDRFILPLYVDLEGKGVFFSLEWPGMKVIGGEVHTVKGFAPTIVKSGESFELSVRSEDFLYNRAGGQIPAYEVLLNGRPFTTIPGGPAKERSITVLEGLKIRDPGIYRFSFRATDHRVWGESNPIIVKKDPAHRIFWGELHGHSDFAEAQGSLEGYYQFGRYEARLDFLSLSEHDLWMDDYEWKRLRNAVRYYKEEGSFIPILGYEWTVDRAQGGHHNVYFRTPDHDRVPRQEAWILSDLYDWLNLNAPEDVLIIPHAHKAGVWTMTEPDLERLVEIYSMHGTFEWYGNQYLKQGHEIGFVATSDNHSGHPGYSGTFPKGALRQFGGLTAVIATANTSNIIFSALRNRSVYATSGPRIILEADLNGAKMGTRQDSAKERQLRCRVVGTSPIDRIEIIRNGEVVFGRGFLNAPLKPHCWIQVGFESSSRAFTLDNPRGYRSWKGTLKVEGARIVSVQAPGFRNRYVEKATIDSNLPNQINFLAETRGRMDVMLVELVGVDPQTSFEMYLEPTRESGVSRGFVRSPASIPAENLKFEFSGMKEGRMEQKLKVSSSYPMDIVHVDRVKLQAVNPNGAINQKVEWTDPGPVNPGDYYYFRITQLDGNQAWSSPFWVGKK